MVCRKNTRNPHNSVYLYEFRVTVRHPTNVRPLKSTCAPTYKHTYKFSENPRDPAITGYLRSINAIDSTWLDRMFLITTTAHFQPIGSVDTVHTFFLFGRCSRPIMSVW